MRACVRVYGVQVYDRSVDDEMARLDMLSRVAQLQMAVVEDEQVRQRQEAVRDGQLLLAYDVRDVCHGMHNRLC